MRRRGIAGATVVRYRLALSATLALCGGCSALGPRRPPVETLFYMTNSRASVEGFRQHADHISIVGPQVFAVEGDGIVRGEVDPEVLGLARTHGIQVMPLIHNPGFDQEMIHQLLNDSAARARTVASMVDLAAEHGFWGWQFDFENIHVSDRDRLTAFYRETAEAFRPRGLALSIAVVPGQAMSDSTPFHAYMQANWRGSFDLPALAAIGDFISFMTYAQHGTATPPGPVAGLPWMRAMLDYALAAGVPPEKLSLGIPAYSGYWYPAHTEERGPHGAGAEIHFDRAMDLIAAHGATLRWLPGEGVHYAFWPNAGTFEWIFLEDRRSFERKVELFESYRGLRGVSVWVLGAEDPGIWEVVEERLPRRVVGR